MSATARLNLFSVAGVALGALLVAAWRGCRRSVDFNGVYRRVINGVGPSQRPRPTW